MRLHRLYQLLVHKYFFDELIDAIFVRPALWLGRFAQQSFERVVINGLLVGTPLTIVRAGSATVRALQTGFLRYYAALLLLGLIISAFYFLVRSA
jgi:NADH-quinone oxidoreductase subunit L